MGQRSDDLPADEEGWRERLPEKAYNVLREGGTEPKFSGRYVDHDDDGTYRCAGCGTALFDSETKFKSGSGWPSFFDVLGDAVTTHRDTSHGMIRTEIRCATCEGHLGHVFEDGPEPTGQRYCINSAALDFSAED